MNTALPAEALATGRRVDANCAPLLVPAVMAVAMSFVMSLVQTIARLEFAPNLVPAWLRIRHRRGRGHPGVILAARVPGDSSAISPTLSPLAASEGALVLPGGLAVVPADLGEGAELVAIPAWSPRQGRIGCCLRG